MRHNWTVPKGNFLAGRVRDLPKSILEASIQREVHLEITRRSAALGGLSLLTGTSVSTMSHAELGCFLGVGEGLEDFWLATDAYIYGYPLTMEMIRTWMIPPVKKV